MQQKLFQLFLLQEAGTFENKIEKEPRKPLPKLRKYVNYIFPENVCSACSLRQAVVFPKMYQFCRTKTQRQHNLLREKTYSFSIDDDSEDKKAKDAKKCVIKIKLKFENYKRYLEATRFENKVNHLERNQIVVDSP